MTRLEEIKKRYEIRHRPPRGMSLADMEYLFEAAGLAEELYDDGPCYYDHHAYCQGHFLGEYPCPHGRAQELFKG